MKYRYKTRPYKHQVKALKKMLRNKGGGLFMEMGTGKTKVAIDFACVEHVLANATRVLVVCPKSVISVWVNEIPKHAGLPYEKIATVGTDYDWEYPGNGGTMVWKITNYDKLRNDGLLLELQEWLREDSNSVVLFDESHKIKSPTGKQSIRAMLVRESARFCILMTGTPISKNPLDLFGQFRAYDRTIFGTSWPSFKKTYAVFGGYGGYILLKYLNLKKLRKKIKPHIFQARKKDCLDLPSRTHEVIPVRLQRSRKIYDDLATEAVIELAGQEILVDNVLARMSKLSQIAGGRVKVTDDDTGETRRVRVGTEKLDTFRELIGNMADQGTTKVVVFCRYLGELKDIAEACHAAGYKVLLLYGAVPQNLREQRIAEFDETEVPTVFLSQISTGSLGISLTAASEAIFYSHTFNYAEYSQACDRLHRIGQLHKVTYYHLLAKDTVDETVWLALKTKKDVADLVLKHPKLMVGPHAA